MTPELFWSRTDRNNADGCWVWTGQISRDGYGKTYFRGRSWRAHRVAYTLALGEIPDGLQLDHVLARGCRSKKCVNPAHLEAVTLTENLRRAPGVCFKVNAAKTHCPKGHEYTAENTSIQVRGESKMRSCKTCRTAWVEANREKVLDACRRSRIKHLEKRRAYDKIRDKARAAKRRASIG